MTSLDCKLLTNILWQLEQMIRSREEMVSWIQKSIDDMKLQEGAIKGTKIGAAVLGAVSFVAIFSPFAPLAVGGMAFAGGACVATTAGDLIANRVKRDNIEEKLKSINTGDSDLEKLLQQLDTEACQIAKEFSIPKEDAVLFLLVAVPKMAIQLGVQAVKTYHNFARMLPDIKDADAMKLGVSFTQAVKLSTTIFEGGRATGMGAGEVARVETGLAITKSVKVFAEYVFGVGIADVVHIWKTENPNRKSAEELLPKLKENVKILKEMKKKYLELNNYGDTKR